MRRVTAILLGWLVVLTASICFGQSYNASHVFRSRTLSRPTVYYRSDDVYRYSFRPGLYSYGGYSNTANRSRTFTEPSYYSRRLGATSRARTAASLYSPAGLDASRSLYRPGLGYGDYGYDYEYSAYRASDFDWSVNGYREGGRYRNRDDKAMRDSLSKYFGD